MKVLVIGQGGREHALVWKIRQSKRVSKLYCAPGNGGTGALAANVAIKADDITGLIKFCEDEKIDFTVVGPEAPLAAGIVDAFEGRNLKIFGPTKNASALESSKIFTKKLARDNNIPTADFEIFNDAKRAKEFVKAEKYPLVIKADGLAEGKGVIIAENKEEAFSAIDKIMTEKAFGSSGDKIIVEKCLEGEEASIIVVSDGEDIVPLASSQDHKRVSDGDKGANTGGMGAYSPAPVVTDALFEEVIAKIIKPAISGMKAKGAPVKGVLYAGVMITKSGPKLLEFNVRFGDPETQAILPRLNSDIIELLERSQEGALKGCNLDWDNRYCVCVVMASGGYPGKYEKGKEVSGIKNALGAGNIMVFHAGTKFEAGKILTSGGRVLSVAALGGEVKNAIDEAYKACEAIKFDRAHYRRDIGHRALSQEVKL